MNKQVGTAAMKVEVVVDMREVYDLKWILLELKAESWFLKEDARLDLLAADLLERAATHLPDWSPSVTL